MAVTQTGTAPISRLHDRVHRREAITRVLRRTAAAAVGLMRRLRVLIRHRAAVIRRQRDPTRRLLPALTQPRRDLIRHPPTRPQADPIRPQAAATLLLAAVMAAEVIVVVEVEAAAVVEADRMEVAAEDLRMEAEVTLEAAADRTDTKIIEQQLEPAPNWGGLFFRENVFGY